MTPHPDPAACLALADRVEAAPGPCPRLDAEVLCATLAPEGSKFALPYDLLAAGRVVPKETRDER